MVPISKGHGGPVVDERAAISAAPRFESDGVAVADGLGHACVDPDHRRHVRELAQHARAIVTCDDEFHRRTIRSRICTSRMAVDIHRPELRKLDDDAMV
jgi:hypothetical protein